MEKCLHKRKHPRLEFYDYSQAGTYFLTICTRDRKKILSNIAVGTPVPGRPKESCPELSGHAVTKLLWHGQIADKIIRKMDDLYEQLSVDKYVIMPDHIHFLITIHDGYLRTGVPTRPSEIAQFVGSFKRFCNKEYGENIWQGRYYDHVIRNQQDYNEIWEYIENNPCKWAVTRDMI